jgi:hypothetical protein
MNHSKIIPSISEEYEESVTFNAVKKWSGNVFALA